MPIVQLPASEDEILADLSTSPLGAALEKLAYIMTPGAVADFDPHEAEAAGAFRETALSDEEAFEASNEIAGV